MFNLGPVKLLATVSLVAYKTNRFTFQLKNKFLNTKIWIFFNEQHENLKACCRESTQFHPRNPYSSTSAGDWSTGEAGDTLRLRLTECSEVLLPFTNQSGKYLKCFKSYEPIHLLTAERNPHNLSTCRCFSTSEMHHFYKIFSIFN